MTPENVLRASELIEELESCRSQFLAAQRTERFYIGFDNEGVSLIAKGGEFLDEIRNAVISTLTKQIADLERELRALGVELPAPDFVDMPTGPSEARQPDPDAAR